MYSFSPELLFTKGIAYAEFFDIGTDNLEGYSRYITDFSPNGSAATLALSVPVLDST